MLPPSVELLSVFGSNFSLSRYPTSIGNEVQRAKTVKKKMRATNQMIHFWYYQHNRSVVSDWLLHIYPLQFIKTHIFNYVRKERLLLPSTLSNDAISELSVASTCKRYNLANRSKKKYWQIRKDSLAKLPSMLLWKLYEWIECSRNDSLMWPEPLRWRYTLSQSLLWRRS